MSYFVVISGPNSVSLEVAAGCLVPIAQAQSYIASLGADLARVDGSPSFLWDDGSTGTSDHLVCAAEDAMSEGHPIEPTAFGQAILNCEALGVSLRVWWANNSLDAYIRVPSVVNSTEAFAIMRENSGNGPAISFAMGSWRAAI